MIITHKSRTDQPLTKIPNDSLDDHHFGNTVYCVPAWLRAFIIEQGDNQRYYTRMLVVAAFPKITEQDAQAIVEFYLKKSYA